MKYGSEMLLSPSLFLCSSTRFGLAREQGIVRTHPLARRARFCKSQVITRRAADEEEHSLAAFPGRPLVATRPRTKTIGASRPVLAYPNTQAERLIGLISPIAIDRRLDPSFRWREKYSRCLHACLPVPSFSIRGEGRTNALLFHG
jgi:hypothetical protein